MLSEAVSAYNLRNENEDKLNTEQSSWPRLYGAVLAFCRHNLSAYDQLRTETNRESLDLGNERV